MKIKPIVFSISGAIIISLFFTLSLFWIFYEYSRSLNSAKDAINTLGGYFGGIATLWAAIIAAYLFNDWKDESQYKLINQNREQVITNTRKLKDLGYDFYTYSHQDKNINMELTYSRYLEYIWCFHDLRESISNYIVTLKTLNLSKSKELDLEEIQKSLNNLNSLYENIKFSASEMKDPISINTRIHPIILELINIENFCKTSGFDYELNYLKKDG